MAHLFKQRITRPMPDGAELFTRNGECFARWTDGKGRKKTARVTGDGDAARIVTESGTWYARIRLANGSRVDVSTGCRDKSAAASRLVELAAEQEKIRAGIISEREANTAKHGHALLDDARQAFLDSMTARGCSSSHVKKTKAYLKEAADALGWRAVRDMNRAALEGWMEEQRIAGRGARVCNGHLAAWNAFGNWMFRAGRIQANPFTGARKFDAKADRRRVRRALTVEELAALIQTARTRPVTDALKGNPGGGAMKKNRADVKDRTLDRLRFLGWTRALAYWTAAATGLRWGELRSITLGAVCLDVDPPHLVLAAKDEKARRGAQIPLPGDLAAELGMYLPERRSRLVGLPGASVVPFPCGLDEAPLFDVPAKMSAVFDADREAAGIPKRDGSGRVVDVHALRHTFGTMLARAGVPLQLAQRAMRHSTPELTANVYTHLGLVDVAGAVDRLPGIRETMDLQQARAAANSVTPFVTPTGGESSTSGVNCGKTRPVETLRACGGANGVPSSAGNGIQDVAGEKNGGPCRIRTCDLVIKSHTGEGCKALPDKGLQDGESSVTPSVTPDSEKAVILAALRGLDRDTLLDLLAEALGGAKGTP